MNFRLSQPAHLVAIGGIEELRYAARRGRGARRWRRCAPGGRRARRHRSRAAAAARRGAGLVAHPPIRHRGTVCGSLAHADPAPSSPRWHSRSGRRSLRGARPGSDRIRRIDFFQGAFTTALAPEELLAEVRFPLDRGNGHAILECARTHGNFALAGAVSVLRLDEARRARNVAIVVFGACPCPTRVDDRSRPSRGRGSRLRNSWPRWRPGQPTASRRSRTSTGRLRIADALPAFTSSGHCFAAIDRAEEESG